MGHIITVYLGADYPGGQAGIHGGRGPSGPSNGSHRLAMIGPHVRPSQPVVPDHPKTARSETGTARGRMDGAVTVALSPSRSPTEFGPVDAHPAVNSVEAVGAQGGGPRTGTETGRGGTGAPSLSSSGTFGSGGSAPGGGGSGAGGDGPGGGQAKSNSYAAAQFAYIRGLILKNLVYPPEARRAGLRGRVTVGFIIREEGLAQNIRIVESSGHDVLDRTVIETIRRCQPFPRPPARAELTIPIVFKLK